MRLQHKRLILLHFCFVVYKLIKANLQLLKGGKLKLKRHLSASSPHSTTTKGATTITTAIAATIITTTTIGYQHKGDFKAIVDLPSPSPTSATPPWPTKRVNCATLHPLLVRPPLLLLSVFCRPPAAAFGQFPFEWNFSIFHRINILSLSLSFSLSFVSLSPSLFVYILVFLCALFSFLLLLLWVRSQLPSAFSALCVSPPRSSSASSPSSMSRLI